MHKKKYHFNKTDRCIGYNIENSFKLSLQYILKWNKNYIFINIYRLFEQRK